MDLHNTRNVISFIIIVGILAYLGASLWSALYLTVLPMDDDWCLEAHTRIVGIDRTGREQYETECILFKNQVEKMKYEHNVMMRDRNSRQVWFRIGAGAVLGFVTFNTLPKRRGLVASHDTENAAVAIVVGVIATMIVPMVLGWILPAPVTWFPQSFNDLYQARVEAVLENIMNAVY